mmetsp:Transcript_67764/g.218959  ORF Transcript_67764/g.218959 Transcript_67764/m.218959 type:complete len:382 (-) Transcript_67764:278-1423(-)
MGKKSASRVHAWMLAGDFGLAHLPPAESTSAASHRPCCRSGLGSALAEESSSSSTCLEAQHGGRLMPSEPVCPGAQHGDQPGAGGAGAEVPFACHWIDDPALAGAAKDSDVSAKGAGLAPELAEGGDSASSACGLGGRCACTPLPPAARLQSWPESRATTAQGCEQLSLPRPGCARLGCLRVPSCDDAKRSRGLLVVTSNLELASVMSWSIAACIAPAACSATLLGVRRCCSLAPGASPAGPLPCECTTSHAASTSVWNCEIWCMRSERSPCSASANSLMSSCCCTANWCFKTVTSVWSSARMLLRSSVSRSSMKSDMVCMTPMARPLNWREISAATSSGGGAETSGDDDMLARLPLAGLPMRAATSLQSRAAHLVEGSSS